MTKLGQSSFRRILLSRFLLLSVPVLLVGVYVTYRKTRSVLLETARQNLTESAGRKGESIQQAITALKSNLLTASESTVFQSNSPAAKRQFVNHLAQQLPTQIQCVQLTDLKANASVASTCGNRLLIHTNSLGVTEDNALVTFWPQQLADPYPNRSQQVYVTALFPQNASTVRGKALESNTSAQLHLVFSAPIYNPNGQLQYALSVQAALLKPEQVRQGSLSGYPVVINQARTILVHPYLDRVGRNINQEADAQRLERVVQNAIAGQQDFQHLFSFEKNGVELLAGYSSIPSPITTEHNQKWVILAVTRLDSALAGLKEIQDVLLQLTCGLLVASLLATLYVARDLARPLEKLRDYALHQSQLLSTERIPHNLKIREFNQLAEAFDQLIERLKNWAEELETAWKEAQTANQLKNQFLATTSHELRTPLNGIIGCLRLVQDGFCDDREEELDFLKRADDAAIHLLGIINDVLDIAKIEAGKLSVEMELVDLRRLLDEVISLQAIPIQQKGLTFYTNDLLEVIPVRADPAKLKQVLLNVVGNAVKFTESGSITIKTRIEQIVETSVAADKDKSYPHPVHSTSQVVITVKDTGIGIDPAQQHKLFRPFVMVDGSTTRKFGGTGLGLAISRNLIELMGGCITLSSEGNNQGTTVEISLPLIEPSLLQAGEASKASAV